MTAVKNIARINFQYIFGLASYHFLSFFVNDLSDKMMLMLIYDKIQLFFGDKIIMWPNCTALVLMLVKLRTNCDQYKSFVGLKANL